MPNAPLTDDEIAEIKNRLGYGSITASALPWIETALAFEQVVQQNVNGWGANYIRETILPNLRQLDDDIFAARSRYKAARLEGEITLNPREHEMLVGQRGYWLDRLAETVRIPRATPPGGSGGARIEVC